MQNDTRKPYVAPKLAEHGALGTVTLESVIVTPTPEPMNPDLFDWSANV